MSIDYQTVLVVFYALMGIDVVIIIASLINKLRHKTQRSGQQKMNDIVQRYFREGVFPQNFKNKNTFLETYINFQETLSLDQKTRTQVNEYISRKGVDKSFIRKLNSPFKNQRLTAVVYLGHMDTEPAINALEQFFGREKKFIVKVFAANAICLQGNTAAICNIVESLVHAPRWYIEKIQPILFEFGKALYDCFPSLLNRKETEIIELLIGFGSVFIAEDLKEYIITQSRSVEPGIRVLAAKALSVHYPEELQQKRFIESGDIEILKLVIKALSFNRTPENVDRIIEYISIPELEEHIVYAVSTMARHEPKLLTYLLKLFENTTDKQINIVTAKVLSNRIEYFLLRILTSEKDTIKKLLLEILQLNMLSEIIGFLNKNNNREIENEIIDVIYQLLGTRQDLRYEFGLYLNDRILKKLCLEKSESEKVNREQKKEKGKVRFLITILVILFALFPAVFVLRRHDMFSVSAPIESLTQFILDFNYLLVYYSVTINFIYIIILILSIIGSSIQARLWKLKKLSFLFKSNILPSISIIAPAYSEEATIIESTNSLLNLQYPNYELIVVNDGSPDDTLNTLISYYNLEKYDVLYDEFLDTKPIRGIYINKNMPKFLVVDKENGGKADSLNAGINLSRKDYFCGIDADSLLEPDALLKAASLMLNTENETVAVGGNIFPINGCSVERGSLTQIRIPRNFIALGQTIEYIRAFMAGRIGWALINSLLIISGAFGIFSKKRIYEVGGYLTESGKYGKDTVGEDMELVVRLSRHMRERKIKHSIHYSFNANCWTEVPEELKVLHRQRDRWHRGLLDILHFHRKLVFNPAFGTVGLVAMPYFFIFEMAGPLIEVQGYLMVAAAVLAGMLNPLIALMLFVSTIMLGILISVTALFIAEKDENYFSVKEFFVLLGFAILENFGFRQLISFWRVSGYFSALKKPKGWGKMVRKGFTQGG
jgi:peptidoglycan-N-acetylglucosamine deacetylase